MTRSNKSVLIIGGSGFVGAQAAQALRKLYPDVPITLGGRDLKKAEAVAATLGEADAAVIDLDRRDLGLGAERQFSAIAMFVKDHTLNSMRYAQDKGAAYVGVSTGVYEMGPEVALFTHRPHASAILMNSTWLAGATLLPALHFAKAFDEVESITLSAVLDPRDMGGPAASADFDRLLMAAPQTSYLKDGKWTWTTDADKKRIVRMSDGVELPATPYSPFDLLSLSAVTAAKNLRFDLALGQPDEKSPDIVAEIIIDIDGGKDGKPHKARHVLSHPQGQAPVTAAGIAVAIERLAGLDGRAPPAPGLYFPDQLIAPEHMMARLKQFGMRIDA
ncbi:NAD(P)-dependent oxidoreductase [Nordella sp. HKS 07]|uniref:NAD(P)-dependent oxidoreductase n=1 Tax=Nordella sp. HKS 07 TaxID=2712222 RepID=UPI0013E0F110|nr:NAD(P)-dependent oxidoreductase [Nordella sp. HKS 07]QIG48618.1 NAD(P)-dependent oxidoreductase [Nordella sp. HKS 07]